MSKMGIPVRITDERFTYREYRQWPDDERWELINGVAYSCAAPVIAHQSISFELARQIGNFLSGKPCRAFSAPCDVFFPRIRELDEDDVDTVVQPDLLVVCDGSKIRSNGIWGAPDLVAEILSPSTSRKDLREKYDLYQRSGVGEYWVIDPVGRWLQQYVLGRNEEYDPEITFVEKGTLVCQCLPGLTVEVASLWQNG
jgi:Uma2 family endonuclease